MKSWKQTCEFLTLMINTNFVVSGGKVTYKLIYGVNKHNHDKNNSTTQG